MYPKTHYPLFLYCFIFICLIIFPKHITADTNQEVNEQRLLLYKKTATVTSIPWYYLAAMDQYERNVQSSEDNEAVISIQFDKNLWFGLGNIASISSPSIITVFQGIGKDGDGDGIADIKNDEDRLYTAAILLSKNGITEDDIKISLWDYYQRDLTVKTIMNIAAVYKKMQKTDLPERHFPIDMDHNYSYNNTWGDRRGFGGNRIHEGTDVFASYGTPVKASTYGVIELKGWNIYGGWRIGVRDIHNIYHYYAHLNQYEEDLEIGDIVKPGDTIGTVGSTGYGPPGTSGKFPPHLHYGMYRDNGEIEWSFDPYPYLKRWEQSED